MVCQALLSGDRCASNPCTLGLSCYLDKSPPYYTCGICPPGYHGDGDICVIIDKEHACNLNPCQHGKSCLPTSIPPYFTCSEGPSLPGEDCSSSSTTTLTPDTTTLTPDLSTSSSTTTLTPDSTTLTPDTTTPIPDTTIPLPQGPTFVHEGVKYYMPRGVERNWTAARDWCQDKGHILASPQRNYKTFLDEVKFLHYAWFGGVWLGASYLKADGKWIWLNNQRVHLTTYTSYLPYNQLTFVNFDSLGLQLSSRPTKTMPEPASASGQTLSTPEVSPENVVSPPEEYFRGVSPLCRRLLDDMKAVRESWGESWNNMSYQQQCRVLDQAIVDEATVRKYDDGAELGPECEYFPKLKLTTGQKVVCDENLTARGFSCSWRDEHSAPFSWHTRSQMDLTLDTPPATPTHSFTPSETPPTTIAGEGRVIPGGRAVYTARPVSLPRPPRFRWHYDPPDDPPEPPSIVVAAPRSATLSHHLDTDPKKSTNLTKFLLVRGKRESSEGSGLLARIKGAVTALTATCLPLRATTDQTSLFYLPHDSDKDEFKQKSSDPLGQALHTPWNKNEAPAICASNLGVSSEECRAEGVGKTLPSLSRLSPDPALVGYVCSLPEDDDDDVPYTAAHPQESLLNQTYKLPERNPESLLSQSTSTYEDKNTNMNSNTCISLPADLPTPLPTPTVSDAAKTVSTALSQPTSSSPLPPSSSHMDDTLSAISEPDSSTDALDTPREEQPLLRTRGKRDFENDESDMFISVLSSKRESNIPKTGFDFLDNW
ncbi:hypothetical protein Pcinc_021373 [Petrolisthes cinctipes]|uniref:DUF4706 domain-containing protein n=1 Tax=Petrolisthes cinctipes TaxID=88211 RepID=A0AAE1KHN1_PETCI|nr:hypothetical protein Pcinc_021373 [Petrolisthes cinctipes]